MPVTGRYIARRFRRGAATYIAAYVTAVKNEILPVFGELSTKATQVSEKEFQRLNSHAAPSYLEADLSSLAEAAAETGQLYFNTMSALRRTSLTLYSVGLFHLLEQLLADLCRDESFGIEPPQDSKLEIVVTWYKKHFRLNLKSLESWTSIDELRLLANAAKHGDGPSTTKLRKLRPDLFQDPQILEQLPDFPNMYTAAHVRVPLAGQDIFVSESTFDDYGGSVFEILIEIAEHFEAQTDTHFFADD